MKKVDKSNEEVSFKRKGHSVVIRTIREQVTLEIDGTVHEVRFLDNGRPYTHAFVTTMAHNVREFAEMFVDTTVRQKKHWDELAGHCADGPD